MGRCFRFFTLDDGSYTNFQFRLLNQSSFHCVASRLIENHNRFFFWMADDLILGHFINKSKGNPVGLQAEEIAEGKDARQWRILPKY